jgi:hypothetical protein
MPRLVTLLALGLVVVGVAYPLATRATSMTAWIPAMLGGAMLLLGLWKHRAARGVTMLLALAGVAACVVRLTNAQVDFALPAHQALALTSVLCGAVFGALLRTRA